MEDLKNTYKEMHSNPPYPNNIPEIAGKICWAKNLIRRAIDPLTALNEQCHERLVGSEKGRALIKEGNKFGILMFEYLGIQEKLWKQSIPDVNQGLHATLLVKTETTDRLLINWDAKIPELAAEVKTMKMMDISVPDEAEE